MYTTHAESYWWQTINIKVFVKTFIYRLELKFVYQRKTIYYNVYVSHFLQYMYFLIVTKTSHITNKRVKWLPTNLFAQKCNNMEIFCCIPLPFLLLKPLSVSIVIAPPRICCYSTSPNRVLKPFYVSVVISLLRICCNSPSPNMLLKSLSISVVIAFLGICCYCPSLYLLLYMLI